MRVYCFLIITDNVYCLSTNTTFKFFNGFVVICCFIILLNFLCGMMSTSYLLYTLCFCCLFCCSYLFIVIIIFFFPLYNPACCMKEKSIEMSQRPPFLFLFPFMTILLFFIANNRSGVRLTLHSSSPNCSSEIRDAIFNPRRIIVLFLSAVSAEDNGICPSIFADRLCFFGNCTEDYCTVFRLANTCASS